MAIYLLTILCYCIGLYFLWQDPSNALYRFIFYITTSIPIALFCQKYVNGKRKTEKRKPTIKNTLLVGIVVLLGSSIMLLTLTDFPKEYKIWFNMIFALFAICTIILIIWSNKKHN